MNWDELLTEFCEKEKCSEAQIMATSQNPFRRREARLMQKKQKEAMAARTAVQKALEENPHYTREEAYRRACSFVISGLILSLLAQAIISVFLKRAIEWFLDKYYNKETANGSLSVPAE
jgi:hypothetical protein